MSNTPYLDSLRRARRALVSAMDESPLGAPRIITSDAWKLIDNGIRRLEEFEEGHEKVFARKLAEQERAKLDVSFSHGEMQ